MEGQANTTAPIPRLDPAVIDSRYPSRRNFIRGRMRDLPEKFRNMMPLTNRLAELVDAEAMIRRLYAREQANETTGGDAGD